MSLPSSTYRLKPPLLHTRPPHCTHKLPTPQPRRSCIPSSSHSPNVRIASHTLNKSTNSFTHAFLTCLPASASALTSADTTLSSLALAGNTTSSAMMRWVSSFSAALVGMACRKIIIIEVQSLWRGTPRHLPQTQSLTRQQGRCWHVGE